MSLFTSSRIARNVRSYLLAFVAISATHTPGLAQQASGKFSLHVAGKLPRPLLMHGTAVVGNRLYVLGGNWEEQTGASKVDHWPKEVYSAEITAKSTLGQWRPETPMPEARCYIENCIQVINDRIYVLGGNVHPTETSKEGEFTHADTVIWTRVQENGTLAPWQKSEPFGGKRSCAASCASDRHLYLLGGTTNGRDGLTDIVYADIAGTSSGNTSVETGVDQIDAPRNWRRAGDLPIPMWYMGAAILENTLYVWGGHAPTQAELVSSNKVFSTTLQPDGKVGQWREETAMKAGTNSAGFCGFNDYLVCVAGRLDAGMPTSNIQFAHIQDKRLEPWYLLDSDVQSRVYHSLGLDKTKGILYITGGRYRQGPGRATGHIVDAVQAFQLPQRQPTGTGAATASSLIAQKFNQPLQSALSEAKQANKKVLVMFYSPAVPAAQRLADNVLSKPEFEQMSSSYIRSAVDVSGDGQTVAAHYGVYRVPCLVELAADGAMVKRSATLSTADEVKSFLTAR